MTGQLVPLLALVGAWLPLDSSPPDFGTALQQLASEFKTDATQLMMTVDGAVIDISRIA
ncbi:MAG: hypothetical protein OK456_06385 [Thaumarchaeota archaeon]|nr:hypothetical protein [Nitrososphaerota archaeon]